MDHLKREAARRALSLVRNGMKLGLGTGSTAAHFVALLGERIRQEGLQVIGVPTSEQTKAQALKEGIPLTTLDETPQLDLTIDGADELDAQLRLIKGGGGALLREKIVAKASRRMIVIADMSKKVEMLGAFPLPIEVARFGLAATRQAVREVLEAQDLPSTLSLRTSKDGLPFITDEGHSILDARLERIGKPEALAANLDQIPGVMGHGLFLGIATGAFLAASEGILALGETEI